MKDVISILAGAGFTVGVSIACGSLLLRALRIRLCRFEATLFAFIAGSGVLSLLVTLFCLTHVARKGVFLWTGLALIAAAVWRARVQRIHRQTLSALRLDWLAPVALLLSALFIYYFFNALAPEISPDGSGYHLSNVARILRHRGFDWSYHSMYAYLSEGAEMLYLFAFAFGRHSAAAMVHFAFLCTLPLLMICYGRRFGLGKASLFAALLMFGSPVVAKDGVSAYNDLVVVTVIYAVFYLLQVWDEDNSDNILILIGFLSGYAYAVKYTAVLTLPFALAWLKWRRRFAWTTLVRLAAPALLLIVPWVLRNWIWLGNPFAPFANSWFPNPYFHPGMERIYVDTLKHYEGIKHWWQIPLELTLRGGLVGGVFNPTFLMFPLSLLSLRYPQGRRLLLTSLVFAAPAWFNTGSRFLIPAAPFVAMALGMALETIPAALPLVTVFTALLAWPPAVSAYCDSGTWRIGEFPFRTAVRKEPVEPYILKYQPDFALKRVLDLHVPPGERVFSFAGRPDSYFDRDVIISYESTLGNLINDILWAPQSHPPDFHQIFRFLPVDLRAVRVTNNSTNDNFWTVTEMRVFSQGREVPRAADWRIGASPNPWEAPLAFDNSYATRWSTWEGMRPRAHIEIQFPRVTRIDSVVLECEPAWSARLQVDVQLPSGRWVPLTDTAEMQKVDVPEGIRRAATRDVKLLGIRYLLVNEGDFVYQDFNKYIRFWGLTQLTQVNGTHFYRID